MKLFIKKNLLWILTFIPLIEASIALGFLPDIIPIRWGFGGNINTFGSKYVILSLPIAAIVFLGVYTLRSRLGTATENKYAVTVTAVIFNVIMCLILIVSFKSNISREFNSIRIVTLFMGITFIIMGNYMPKFKRNGIIGIRTPWTMGSDEVWYETHRIGGKLTVVCGLLMIIISLIFKSLTFVPMLVIVMLEFFILTIYSYIMSGKQMKL